MTNSCKNCKFWKQKRDAYDDSQAFQAGFGECEKALMLDRIIGYDEEKDCFGVMPEHKDEKMCVMDASSYFAVLYTKPDFLCSEHKAKAKP